MKHFLGILFPFFVCLSVYGIFLLGSAMTGGHERQAAEKVVSAEISDVPDSVVSAFNQTDLFSDSELQEAVSLFAAKLSGVSPRIGACVSLSAVSSGESDAAEKTLSSDEQKQAKNVEKTDAKDSGENPAERSALPSSVKNGFEGDIWRIDTTFASRTSPALAQMRKLIFYRWIDSRWSKASADEFFDFPFDGQPLIFYVHGNRTELNTAAMQGIVTLKNYARHFPESVPARLVIWNWDAEKISVRPRVDFPVKAGYADFQGFYLAEIIENIPADKQILLVGHSFGARTILSALHLLSGGAMGNRTLKTLFPDESPVTEVSWKKVVSENAREAGKALPKIDALLVASAISCDVLSEGGMFSGALNSVARLRVTRNPSDHALKYYPLMKGARKRLPEAMGAVGPVLGNVDSELRSKVQVIPLDNPTHQYLEYISMKSVQNALKF